jgi:hypothetical protein
MRVWIAAVLVVLATIGPVMAQASLTARAARVAARGLGGSAAREGAENLAGRIASLVTRNGDDVVAAVRRVGPGAVRIVEQAGEHGTIAARLLGRHGTEAAHLVGQRDWLALVARHGDDAATALMRHGRIAAEAIGELGAPGARALAAVAPQNARRIAMLAADGRWARLDRAGELLDVVARHGDRAMEFIWRNKCALAVAGVLATFVRDPLPYLNGVKDLAATATRPVTELPSRVITALAHRSDWSLVAVIAIGLAMLGLTAKALWDRFRPLQRSRNPRTEQQ